MGGRPVGGAQRLPSALYLPTDDYVPVYLTVYHGVSVPVAAAYAGARQEVTRRHRTGQLQGCVGSHEPPYGLNMYVFVRRTVGNTGRNKDRF